MLGKILRTLKIIQIGIMIIISTTTISSDNLRYHKGMWSFDPQLLYLYNQVNTNQPSQLRNYVNYWYPIRQPILTPRKQRMGNFHIKQRYKNQHFDIPAPYGNSFRNILRSTPDDLMSTNNFKTLIKPLIVSSTPTPISPLNIRPPMNTQSRDIYEDIKSCAEKNITTPTQSSFFSVPNSIRPLESTTSSTFHSMLPMTDNAFIPYITHTYFTLDDVIIPAASDNYKSEIRSKKLIPYNSDIKKTFTTQKSKLFNDLTTEKLTDMTTVPTENTVSTVQPTIPWIPITTTIVDQNLIERTTSAPIKNQTIQENFNPVASIKNLTTTNETPFRENRTQAIRYNEFCPTCLRPKISLTNITLNSVEPTESKAKSIVHEKKPIKKPNITLKTFQATRNEIKKDFKKPNVTPNIPRIAEPSSYKSRRNISSQLYMRRRKLDRKVAKPNNFTNYQAKNLSQVTETTVKPIQIKTNVEKINLRTVKPINKTKTIPETISTVATTALAAESAIMTISNTNGKFVKGSIPRSRRLLSRNHIINHVDLVQTTVTPKLPIEVYFTKLSKTK